MCSPLGSNFAKAFPCHHEKECFNNHFKPMICKKYVDDIFVLFSSKQHLQLFLHHINEPEKRLKFTSEADNYFSFLEIKITRHK